MKKQTLYSGIIFLLFFSLLIFSAIKQGLKISQVSETAELGEEIIFPYTGEESGKGVYEIFTKESQDPKIFEIEIDPLDAEIGKEQSIVVRIKTKSDSINENDSVIATVITDNKELSFPLELRKAEGTDYLKTHWQGFWEKDDITDSQYLIKVAAKNEKGEHNVDITLVTSSCSPNLGGNHTVTTSCAFSGTVNGVDNGNLTINSGQTLTINANQTIAWNPGFSVINNGSISINKVPGNAQLRKTFLWMTDTDQDRYPASLTQIAQDTAPANGRRRRDLISWTVDCFDTNANVFPGQTSFFTSHRGDNSFDYNCDGLVFKAGSCQGSSCTLSGTISYNASWDCIGGTCVCAHPSTAPSSCAESATEAASCGGFFTSNWCEADWQFRCVGGGTACTTPDHCSQEIFSTWRCGGGGSTQCACQ